jgi:hypothetical protein
VRLLIAHRAFEARFPGEAEMEEIYENQRQTMHLRSHDTLENYRPVREFPCPGTIRCLDEDENGIATLGCDRCRYETTARIEHLKALQAAPF